MVDKITKQIIKEEIERYLEEHANPKGQVVEKISNYFEQIAQHWCLIRYCTLTNTDWNKCKQHWSRELFNHLNRCGAYKLKNNNSYNNRLQAVKEAENVFEILTDIRVADALVTPKFEDENININQEIFDKTLNDLIQNKNQILHIIANWDKNEIINYIKDI